MRILITGHNGYIGENLTYFLTKKGCMVLGLDRKFDESQRVELFQYKPEHKLDGIVHLAGVSGLESCENNPLSSMINNVGTAFNIFTISQKFNIPVIFTSSQAAKTIELYGVYSEYSNVYGIHKRQCEQYALHLNKHGANIKCLRLCNVYGGLYYLQKKSSVVSKFLNAKRSNEKLYVENNGLQYRDFIHVYDVCEAIYRSLLTPQIVDKPIDVGTGIATSILDLAEMIDKERIVFKSTRTTGISGNVATDLDFTEQTIKFKASIKLKDYINMVLNLEKPIDEIEEENLEECCKKDCECNGKCSDKCKHQ